MQDPDRYSLIEAAAMGIAVLFLIALTLWVVAQLVQWVMGR